MKKAIRVADRFRSRDRFLLKKNHIRIYLNFSRFFQKTFFLAWKILNQIPVDNFIGFIIGFYFKTKNLWQRFVWDIVSSGIQFFHSTMKTHKNINVVRTTVEKEWHWSAYETCLSTILYKKDNCGIRENEEQYFVTKTRRYEYQYHRTKWKIGFFFLNGDYACVLIQNWRY